MCTMCYAHRRNYNKFGFLFGCEVESTECVLCAYLRPDIAPSSSRGEKSDFLARLSAQKISWDLIAIRFPKVT